MPTNVKMSPDVERRLTELLRENEYTAIDSKSVIFSWKDWKEIFPDVTDFSVIRNAIETCGFDRHSTLEICSTEVLFVVQDEHRRGILLQIRNNQNPERPILGAFGGCCHPNESPIDAAIREVGEETTGVIRLAINLMRPYGEDAHFYDYSCEGRPGDRAFFVAHRFVVTLPALPEITTNNETKGTFLITDLDSQLDLVIPVQRDFVKAVFQEHFGQ